MGQNFGRVSRKITCPVGRHRYSVYTSADLETTSGTVGRPILRCLYIIGEMIAKAILSITNLMQLLNPFSKSTQQNVLMLHKYDPWVSVVKVCSNGGFTNIICKIKVKDHLNTANLKQLLKVFFSKSIQQIS